MRKTSCGPNPQVKPGQTNEWNTIRNHDSGGGDRAAGRDRRPPAARRSGRSATLGGRPRPRRAVLPVDASPRQVDAGRRRGGGKGRRVGGDAIGSRRAEMTAVRERQQQHLRDVAKKKKQQQTDMGADDDDGEDGAGERNNPPSVNDGTSSARSIDERMRLMRERQDEKERHRLLEEKRKKQRMLYLKQKALEEEEEERRRKDAELGPGWRYREDPNAATANSINGMNPQSGGGGYKPQARKRRGG